MKKGKETMLTDYMDGFPKGNLSFLYEIPAIGSKFKKAEQQGHKSQKGIYGGHSGDKNYPIKL